MSSPEGPKDAGNVVPLFPEEADGAYIVSQPRVRQEVADAHLKRLVTEMALPDPETGIIEVPLTEEERALAEATEASMPDSWVAHAVNTLRSLRQQTIANNRTHVDIPFGEEADE